LFVFVKLYLCASKTIIHVFSCLRLWSCTKLIWLFTCALHFCSWAQTKVSSPNGIEFSIVSPIQPNCFKVSETKACSAY
jgi:hypothetical protein